MIGAKAFADLENDRGMFVLLFENGKGVRVPASSYYTKSNRRRLTGAYSASSPCVGVFYEPEGASIDIVLSTSQGKGMMISSSLIPQKTTRTSSGVTLMTLKKGVTVTYTALASLLPKEVTAKLPSSGATLSAPIPGSVNE